MIVCGEDLQQPTLTDILVSSAKKTTQEREEKVLLSESEDVIEHPLYQVTYTFLKLLLLSETLKTIFSNYTILFIVVKFI